jgi:hypothetical protein
VAFSCDGVDSQHYHHHGRSPLYSCSYRKERKNPSAVSHASSPLFLFFFLSPKTSSRGEQYVRGPLVNSLGFFFSEPPDEIKNCNLHPLPTPYPSNSDSSMDKIKYFLSGGRSSSVSVCQMKFVHENLTNAWSSAKTRKPPATVCRVWEVVFAMAALSNYPDPEWVVLAWTWTPPLASLW